MKDKTPFVIALHNICYTWEQVEKQLSETTANPSVNETLALMRDQYRICRTHLEHVLAMYDHTVDHMVDSQMLQCYQCGAEVNHLDWRSRCVKCTDGTYGNT